MTSPPLPIFLGTPITSPQISNLILFSYENWGDSGDAHLFFPPPITSARASELPTLSVWCPEDSADPSPDHSITICNSSDSPFSCCGPSLSLADWHSTLPTGRTVWQCYGTHSPNSTLLTYLLPRLLQCWLTFWSLEKLLFGEAVKNSFNDLIANPSPGIAAWRFPPHSLSLNTIRTLLNTFARESFCIEGFGYGSGWAALAGVVTHQHIQPISIFISLGGLALHPSTFRSLVAYHSGRYLAYLKDHGSYVDEKRPRPQDRPVGCTPRSRIPRLRHSLRIVQHLHDRAAPWRLSKLLLSYLYTNGIPVLTLHDSVKTQLQQATNRSPFSQPQLESHFGRYRHKYEYLVPTLKFVSSSTFFTNFLQPPWVLVTTPTCSTFYSPSSPPWTLSRLLTFLPLLKQSPWYSYKDATVPPVCLPACFTRILSLMKLLNNITNASLFVLFASLL